MQGLILAAGMGVRLGEHTKQNPKCMLEINGERLIENQINSLKNAGINKVVIVCGYKKDALKEFISNRFKDIEVTFVDNDDYKTTNNIYSLYLAKNWLAKEDTVLIESDLIFEPKLIEEMVEDKEENIVAVSKYKSWMDGTVVTINNKDNSIKKFYGKNDFNDKNIDDYYKTVNIYKLNKNFCSNLYIPCLENYIKEEKKNEYYEVGFKDLVNNNAKMKAKKIEIEKWYEIDTVQDLDIAKCLFRR